MIAVQVQKQHGIAHRQLRIELLGLEIGERGLGRKGQVGIEYDDRRQRNSRPSHVVPFVKERRILSAQAGIADSFLMPLPVEHWQRLPEWGIGMPTML